MLDDIEDLDAQIDAVQLDVEALVRGLDETSGRWAAAPTSWSAAQCLDHLAVFNRVYLGAMQQAAVKARAQGRLRRGPAKPGFFGRLFLAEVEPPVKARSRFRAPSSIQPGAAPSLRDASAGFAASHAEVRAFLVKNADLDLTGVRFANPILRGVRFSLASGLNIILAHERRHLWQARQALQLYRGAK
jgi:hypothetical protein